MNKRSTDDEPAGRNNGRQRRPGRPGRVGAGGWPPARSGRGRLQSSFYRFAASLAASGSFAPNRRRYLALAASVAVLAIGGAMVSQLAPTTPPPVIASTAVMDGQVLALAPDADEWRAMDGAGVEWIAGARLRTSAGSRVSLDLSSGGLCAWTNRPR